MDGYIVGDMIVYLDKKMIIFFSYNLKVGKFFINCYNVFCVV